ncbi:DMT family transporter [Alteromonas sp. a30]|uniref:DMT family transporter n=1 Tax=Alteromonas sp. a30 TaxID=2730917 RepID=UPI00227E4B56|nr:DMT family transporter [Alteromonas sp. a30]MCY7295000.1 DMT family transporter [Alteromonas sp. a30]
MQLKWVVELLLLSAVWGASFMFMRIASPEIAPAALTFIRCVIATFILGAIVYLSYKQEIRHTLTHWWPLTLLAVTNTALPFSLWGYVSLFMESGPMGVINATAPMFSSLIAFIWLKDKLSKSAIFGMCLGFSGVTILLISPNDTVSIALFPALLGLFACANYGLAACVSKAKAAGLKPMTVAAGSQFYSAIILLPFALISWPQKMPSIEAISSTAALGIGCSGYAFYLYYKLIAEQGIARTMTNMYLIPLFAILWGGIFLGETLALRTAIGGAIILIGVAFTTGYLQFGRKKALA